MLDRGTNTSTLETAGLAGWDANNRYVAVANTYDDATPTQKADV